MNRTKFIVMIFIVFSVCFNRLDTKHIVSNYEIKALFLYILFTMIPQKNDHANMTITIIS